MPTPDERDLLPHARPRGWTIVFALAACEGIIALFYLALLPADVENSLLFGLSASRLALLGLLLVFSAISAGLAWQSVAIGRWLGRAPRVRAALFVLLPLFALNCALLGVILLSLYHTGGDFRYFAYYQRLLPLLLWGGAGERAELGLAVFQRAFSLVRAARTAPHIARRAVCLAGLAAGGGRDRHHRAGHPARSGGLGVSNRGLVGMAGVAGLAGGHAGVVPAFYPQNAALD